MIPEQFIRDAWARLAGVKGRQLGVVETLRQTEWCHEFTELMRNRLIVGYFRYGPFGEANRNYIDYMESIKKRAQEYIDTGNDELLLDIANLCMKQYHAGDHPKKHFKAVDDGEHV